LFLQTTRYAGNRAKAEVLSLLEHVTEADEEEWTHAAKAAEAREAAKAAGAAGGGGGAAGPSAAVGTVGGAEQAAVLWRLARALFEFGAEPDQKNWRRDYVGAALGAARQATAAHDGCAAAHKWLGIALSALGDYEGTRASIASAYTIREHWERAAALDPRDATNVHLLGRWTFALADLGWASRKIAGALFGKPPDASFEEALGFFERAEAIDPGFWKKNQAMLGASLVKLGRKAEAAAWLRKALAIETVTLEDREANEEASKLLKKL
jgi:tetratricopeptide (TPR) repeat protein